MPLESLCDLHEPMCKFCLQDEFEEKANPAAYAFGDGEVEDNFEITKLTEEELAETEQAQSEAEAAQVCCWTLLSGHRVRVRVRA